MQIVLNQQQYLISYLVQTDSKSNQLSSKDKHYVSIVFIHWRPWIVTVVDFNAKTMMIMMMRHLHLARGPEVWNSKVPTPKTLQHSQTPVTLKFPL